jgi:hypothetical protein
MRLWPLAALLLPWSAWAQDEPLVFQEPIDLVTASGFRSDLDLAIDSAGNNHIAYSFSDGDAEIYYTADLGGAWQTPIAIQKGDGDETNPIVCPVGPGNALLIWQSDSIVLRIQWRRVEQGTPADPFPSDFVAGEFPHLLYDAVALAPDRAAVLCRRSGPSIDSLLLVTRTQFEPASEEIIALGLGQRFLAGHLAQGPDGVLHVAVRLATLESGAISRLAYTNNRGGMFAPLTDVLSDARGGDTLLHVDDFNRVYLHARSPTESRLRVSTDGGDSFPSAVTVGAVDIWAAARRPDGLDLFSIDQIDVSMRLHRITGASVRPPVDVPTPGWRIGDIECHEGEHRAATSGSLRFTTTASPEAIAPAGDINADGRRDSADIVRLLGDIQMMAFPTAFAMQRADLNGDLRVDATDVIALVTLILTGGGAT